jgi:hypothetical protein
VLTFANIVSLVGVVLTLGFGIYSVLAGNAKLQPKTGALFLVLAFLYGAQFASAKSLGHPLLSDNSFSLLVTMTVIGLVWLIRDS